MVHITADRFRCPTTTQPFECLVARSHVRKQCASEDQLSTTGCWNGNQVLVMGDVRIQRKWICRFMVVIFGATSLRSRKATKGKYNTIGRTDSFATRVNFEFPFVRQARPGELRGGFPRCPVPSLPSSLAAQFPRSEFVLESAVGRNPGEQVEMGTLSSGVTRLVFLPSRNHV